MASYTGTNNHAMMARCLLLLVALTSMASCVLAARELSAGGGVEAMQAKHEEWMAKHGRTYKDDAEKARRFQVFKANSELVKRSNADKKKKYRLTINNKFADLTSEEFAAMYTGFMPVPSGVKKVPGFKYENVSLSDDDQAVDWRMKGAVTGVKDQGQCGCCWAFSTVAAMEGLNRIKTGKLVSLSEQQLLDCTGSYGNKGCRGGRMDISFKYIIENGGITTEAAYPYAGVQGACSSDDKQPAAMISSYQDVPQNDEDALAAAVVNQPVSVGIDGSSRSFQLYQSGVLTAGDGCGTELTHAVAVVGYGVEQDGTKYWLIKNSWGETWGQGGFMKLERGTNACGVSLMASFPLA